MSAAPVLTGRFAEALSFAEAAHRDQRRKGSGTPYIAHLMSVSALVLEHGGDEDMAIAALLHDAVEDQGGVAMEAAIRARFGDRVAGIVMDCTDAVVMPKPPWRARKEAYLAKLDAKPAESLAVSLADKVHNARTILDDHRAVGDALWERFRGGRDGTLWYYRALADAFLRLSPGPLADRLAETVAALEEAVAR